MQGQDNSPLFIFPRWINYLLPVILISVIGGSLYAPVVFAFGFSPKTMDVGYSPVQPIPYSHELHAGELGIDCRYCHNTVEKAGFAAVPPTQTCMNCHASIKTDSQALQPLRDSWASGKPVEWVKIHDLPDFVYFNHSAHVTHGIGCVSCHGRIDEMERVYQAQPLSMSWCLDCHRAPENYLRPKDQVTNMAYMPANNDQKAVGLQLKAEYHIHDAQYMQSCSTCHR